MPRRKRSYQPGAGFHITARTHNGEFWFEELRCEMLEILDRALARTDARLLAFTIMTNHFHLVLRQGAAPLSQLMQPFCQRTAYAVHRRLSRRGYVMGYRYYDTMCRNEAHLRQAILYTHRNPVEAGMCRNAGDYRWSSDRAYRTVTPNATPSTRLAPATELFASGHPGRTAQQDYREFYAWYDACKRLEPGVARPHSPIVTSGDAYWLDHFNPIPIVEERPRSDLQLIVRQTLAELAPDLTLDELSANPHSRPLIRNAVVERALHAGYQPMEIGRLLNLSKSTVSRVNVARVLRAQPEISESASR